MATEGLSGVLDRIAAAAGRAGRDPASVTLVAVSKSHSVDEIRAVYDQGQRVFGENRAAELAEKAPLLPPDIVWHFVGSIQSRKASLVATHASVVHSMDRLKLARRFASLGDAAPPCLLQVNIGREAQKHGVLPAQAPGLLREMGELGIDPIGLMAIPPAPGVPEDSRPYFRRLAGMAADLREEFPSLRALSMGMTDDYEVAVEEGATLVRVGRAIFGPRND